MNRMVGSIWFWVDDGDRAWLSASSSRRTAELEIDTPNDLFRICPAFGCACGSPPLFLGNGR